MLPVVALVFGSVLVMIPVFLNAGAGREALLWGLVLFALGGTVYWAMRRRP